MRKPVFEVCDQGRPNWPAQSQKLAEVLKFWMLKLEILYYLGSENKGPDQTAWMCRLICGFIVHIWQKQVLSSRGWYIKFYKGVFV